MIGRPASFIAFLHKIYQVSWTGRQIIKQMLPDIRHYIHNTACALQEIEDLQTSVVDVRRPSGLPPIRRSQKAVPKVADQLRLVAGGACIPAPAKVQRLQARLVFPAELRVSRSGWSSSL